MTTAALNLDIFEQYENLEKSGMAAPTAHAVKDFVLATQKAGDFATKSDLREYKAERVNDLKTFEVSQDRKFDQLRHEIKECRHDLKSEIEQVRHDLKSEIEQVRHELKNEINSKVNGLKVDLIKWMIGLFFAQASLTAAVITSLKIFGNS